MTTNAITKPAANSHQACAPGKLILSGEHAVVHGAPALAAAVNQHTTVSFTPVLQAKGLKTAFHDVSTGQFYPLAFLKSFKQGLDKRFEAFKSGDISVQEILSHSDDLAVYSMATLLNYLPMPAVGSKRKLPQPGVLSSRSTIPLGAGMGSSAAVIAATFVLYEHLLTHVQSDDDRFERVRFCERLQHGQGSAIDAACVVYGGLNRVEGEVLTRLSGGDALSLSLGEGWYWFFCGTPTSTTGECVAAVREAHGDDLPLWDAFSACTNALQVALEEGKSPYDAIQENHRLLRKIGVVPDCANDIVRAVEERGGAAKISGAGAVRGDKAGIILAHIPDTESIPSLLAELEWPADAQWGALSVVDQGAYFVAEAAAEEVGATVPVLG